MFRSRQKRVNAANAAILQTSRLFSPLWGEAELTENGNVRFSALPGTLQGLTAIQTWQRQLLGGTMSVNLCLEREIQLTGSCSLRFRSGRFGCKGNCHIGQHLIDQLHADTILMETLRDLDLGGLTITLASGKVTVMLTPYGGGLAFLGMPPLQYPVAFPRDQIKTTAQALERIERIISSHSEAMNVTH